MKSMIVKIFWGILAVVAILGASIFFIYMFQIKPIIKANEAIGVIKEYCNSQ